MSLLKKLLIGTSISVAIILSTVGGVNYLVSNKIDEIKTNIAIETKQELEKQKEFYETNMKKTLAKVNAEYIKGLEASLKTADNQFKIYSSVYVQSLMDRVAKIPNNPSYTEAMKKSETLYDDLMAKTELDNYEFGVNHSILKDVKEDSSFDKYAKLRERLIKNGLTNEQIDAFIRKQTTE